MTAVFMSILHGKICIEARTSGRLPDEWEGIHW